MPRKDLAVRTKINLNKLTQWRNQKQELNTDVPNSPIPQEGCAAIMPVLPAFAEIVTRITAIFVSAQIMLDVNSTLRNQVHLPAEDWSVL